MGLGLLLGALAVGAFAAMGASNSERRESSSNCGQGRVVVYSDHRPNLGQQEKVAFFDKYRELDTNLARLIGEGSGGIGLLINACRHMDVQIGELNGLMSNLREIRDYRNNLAHNKKRWQEMPNPKGYYNYILSEVGRVVDRNSNYVAKKMYKALSYVKSKRTY